MARPIDSGERSSGKSAQKKWVPPHCELEPFSCVNLFLKTKPEDDATRIVLYFFLAATFFLGAAFLAGFLAGFFAIAFFFAVAMLFTSCCYWFWISLTCPRLNPSAL